MAVRLLDTGVARDCSGVLRITVGDGAAVEEGELMFWVGGGGGVRVWERGGEGR
jgi:elongator complex protein 6